MDANESSREKPLQGIRVLEMGQLLAGPFCGQMLAWFGAEVIKLEPPGRGDPLRGWRALDDEGTSWWWRSLARNKKSITVDLRQEEGQALARELIGSVDVLIENFRPGKMESWGMGPDEMRQSNPGLVYTRVSGYGQTGPYKDKVGYASACEALGGFRHVNGFTDRPPVRPNLSIGDTLAGMHGVIGTLLALFHRQATAQSDRQGASFAGGRGQVVDVSILESVYNLMEAVVPEYSGAGIERQPSGSTLTGIVPTNTYRCKDGKFVVIGGNGDSIYIRLMTAAGREDLAHDERLATNQGRVDHEPEIDAVLEAWSGSLDSTELLQILDEAEVPCSPIYSVTDMFEDEHFRARGLFETVDIGHQRELEIPALHPRLQDTPGGTEWCGPELGVHTDEVLSSVLQKSDDEIQRLRSNKIV